MQSVNQEFRMPDIGRVILTTKRMEDVVAFYVRAFGYRPVGREGDRIVELRPPGDGLVLMLHPAAKGQREGQSLVKLVFDVADVQGFRQRLIDMGVEVGPVHRAGGHQFANAKDPAKNPISISSRAFSASD